MIESYGYVRRVRLVEKGHEGAQETACSAHGLARGVGGRRRPIVGPKELVGSIDQVNFHEPEVSRRPRYRWEGVERVRFDPLRSKAQEESNVSVVLYHNPDCSKSKALKSALEDRGQSFSVISYLEAPLSRSELLEIISILTEPAGAMVRKDGRFTELGLDPAQYGDEATIESVVDLLVENPELMQRPILKGAQRAAIGRPLEQALDVL